MDHWRAFQVLGFIVIETTLVMMFFSIGCNTQVENTPAINISSGNSRSLYWRIRSISNKVRSSNWVYDQTFKSVFTLDNNTITTINPNDENPSSITNSIIFY